MDPLAHIGDGEWSKLKDAVLLWGFSISGMKAMSESMKRSSLRMETIAPFLLAISSLMSGCDESRKDSEDDAAASDAEKAVDANAERELREREAVAKNAAEDAAKHAVEEAAKASAAHTLRACCEALGKAGFEQRLMAYMKGVDVCEASETQGKTLSDAADEIRTVLGEKPLPEECNAL